MAEQIDEPSALHSAQSIRADRRQRLEARYGGFDWLATFLGFAVAMFFLLIFLGIVGAVVGAVGFQLHAPVPAPGSTVSGTTQNLGIGALIGSLIALFLAYFIGGYAAGRLARFEGVKNGIGVVLWTIAISIILGIVGAVLGSRFNVAGQLHLSIDARTLTVAGALSLVIALIVMLAGAILGGLLGERYHEPIDRYAGEVAGSRRDIPAGTDASEQPVPAGTYQDVSGDGRVRDLGDVVEVPIVEEELVKQPVVKEVVRVHKRNESEPQTVAADLRKEDVQVEQDDDA